MRQGVGPRNGAEWEVAAHRNPRFQLRRETRGELREVVEHGFAAFLHGEAAQAGGIDAR